MRAQEGGEKGERMQGWKKGRGETETETEETQMSGLYREEALGRGQPSSWTGKFKVSGQGRPGRD